jgi:hypothetical protein
MIGSTSGVGGSASISSFYTYHNV